MLIRHTIIYTVGRGASGAINVLALALYTRLLSPFEYGEYALVLAWVGVANAVVFQWLNMGARRFLAAYSDRRSDFLSTIRSAYLRLTALMVLAATVVAVLHPERRLIGLIGVGTVLACGQSWLELNLELSLASLRPVRYGTLMLIRACVALTCGVLLAYEGLGARGVLIGVTMGALIPGVWLAAFEWRTATSGGRDPVLVRDLLSYGLPLTATYALAFVVTSSDRLLLGWLKGSAVVGPYAAAYDTTSQALIVLMMMVNLSAFPLAVKALEQGTEATRRQLTQHAVLLLAIALPAAAGLALLASNIAATMFGVSFQATAAQLMPWLAGGALLAGLKAFYFDLSFQLGRATVQQVWVSACAAVLNVGLNLWAIPRYGAVGAAAASLTAFLVGCTLSAVLGRRVLKMPLPLREWGAIAAATLIMALALLPFISYKGHSFLVLQVAVGVIIYALAVGIFNVGGSRSVLLRALRR